jgi:hypothetical protein
VICNAVAFRNGQKIVVLCLIAMDGARDNDEVEWNEVMRSQGWNRRMRSHSSVSNVFGKINHMEKTPDYAE